MSRDDPLHPEALETVLFEPDEQRTLAVLPGALWLATGDIVELEDPPRDARVLSTRLQLRGGKARVLVVLDVADGPDAALRGDTPTEVVLGAGADEPGGDLTADLDSDLADLAADLEGDSEVAGP